MCAEFDFDDKPLSDIGQIIKEKAKKEIIKFSGNLRSDVKFTALFLLLYRELHSITPN